MATDERGMAAHLAALDTRVTGLESGVSKIQTSLDALANNLATNSKTPWGVIWSAAGVCLTFLTTIGFLAYSPVREAQNEIKSELRSVVPRVEHERIWRWQERLGESFDRRIQKLEEKIEKRGS